MSFFMLSLLGMPPLAGFAAKFQVFAILWETGREYGRTDAFLAWYFFGLLAVAAINTAISAGYYLRVIRAMTLDDPPADAEPIRVPICGQILIALLTALVLAVGIFWNPLTKAADQAAKSFSKPASVEKRL
jgi:NADH-quinone oxidoreductase subunit N